jgi:hypothetical protein
MTIDWLGALLWIGGGGAFLIAAVWLVRRSELRLSIRPRDPYARIAPGSDGSDPISAYLNRMTGALALPAGDVAEVRAELADHLQDSIATLEAEGFEREAAIREALGRLGPPAELGRQLRAAHQSTRRLLAGVGGGVFAAGGGFVLGYLGGIALALLLVIVLAAVTAVLTLVGVRLPDITSPGSGQAGNSLMLSIMLAVAAAFATRYAVRTSAGLSRRAPRTVAVFWAAAAVLGFGWYALFGLRGEQSWLGVAGELCIPLAAVAGALVRIERPMPHVGRWAIVCSAISVVVLVLGLALVAGSSGSSGSGSGQATESQQSDLHADTVAPAAPAAWLPADDYVVTDQEGDHAGATHMDAQVISQAPGAFSPVPFAPILANWRDLRFEAWHGQPMWQDPGAIGVDTHYSSPIAVQPAVLQADFLQADFHFERMRDARSWWVVLTGVGPDGNRYRLGDGTGNQTDFNGSIWDWLTAPQ